MGNFAKVASFLIQAEAFINSPEGQALIADAKQLFVDVEQAVHPNVAAGPSVAVPVVPASEAPAS